MDNFDKQRRDFLIRALTSGFFATGSMGLSVPANAMGQIPSELPPGRSIYRIKGRVKVDGQLATLDTKITPRSVIQTGKNSAIVFAVGKDAFLMRSHSKVEMQGGDTIISGLRLITGKILSVFGKRKPEQRLGSF